MKNPYCNYPNLIWTILGSKPIEAYNFANFTLLENAFVYKEVSTFGKHAYCLPVSSKHYAYCLPHFTSAYVYVYVYLDLQVLTYTYTYTLLVSSKHLQVLTAYLTFQLLTYTYTYTSL